MMKDKKYENVMINGIEVVGATHKDKNGNIYVDAICPYCNNKWNVRVNHLKSGNTKSCGCLRKKHGAELGIQNRKPNPFYFPIGYDYGVCFFNNIDDYFIFDIDDYDMIKKHTWYGRSRNGNGKIDAYTKINNKTVYLTNYLMNTCVKEGYECDHINQETRDNRTSSNLRNGTGEMNKLNTKMAEGIRGEVVSYSNGKFAVEFPKYISVKIFDTREEAENVLREHTKFTYDNSQEISKAIETNQFEIERFHFIGGALEEIMSNKCKYIPKIQLTNAVRDKANSKITEDEFYLRVFNAIDMHKELKKESA